MSWAGLDAVRKSLARDVDAVALVALLTLGPAPVFLAWAVVDGTWITSVSYLGYGAATLCFNALAYVSFMRAMHLSPLSTTVPLLSLTPALTAIAGALVLDERPDAAQLAGIALVVSGAILLHARREGGLGSWLGGVVRERGARLMLVTALCWSGASTLDKLSLRFASVPAHALVQVAGMGLGLSLLLLVRGRGHELRVARACATRVVAAIALSVAALGLQLMAYQLLFVAVVETAKRAIGVIMALILGRLLFQEPLSVQKVLSVGIIVAGTVLVSQ